MLTKLNAASRKGFAKLKVVARKGFTGVRTKVYGFAGFGVATWAAWSLSPTAGKFTLAASLLLVDFGSTK